MLVCIFLWTVFSYISVCNVSSNGSWTRGMYAGGVTVVFNAGEILLSHLKYDYYYYLLCTAVVS